MVPVLFDPQVHEYQDIPFVGYLRRELNDPLLFTFRHRRTGNWLVGAWVADRWGRFLELAVLGRDPVGSRSVVNSLKTMKRGSELGLLNKKKNLDQLRSHEKRWAMSLNEQEEESEDARDFLRKRARHEKRHHVVPGPH